MNLRADYPVYEDKSCIGYKCQESAADPDELLASAAYVNFELHHHPETEQGEADQSESGYCQPFT